MPKHLTLKIGLVFLVTPFVYSQLVNAEAPDILPGLWENKIAVSSESGQIEQALEQAQLMMQSLPPEQQQMVKDMMAKQGVSFDWANRSIKTCMTKEMIDNFAIAQTDDECSQSFEETSKNHYKMTMECPDQDMNGSGDYVIHSNKSYTGTIIMDVNMNGAQDKMTMQQEGTWIGEDCGDITPE